MSANVNYPRVSKNIEGLINYGPPENITPCDLVLDFNEGKPPGKEVLQYLANLDPKVFSRYSKPAKLESLLAEEFNLDPAQVLVSAGGDEAIDRICRAYLFPDREIVVAAPTFEMFNVFARMTGGKSVHVPWPEGAYPVKEVIAEINENTGVVQIISPNNPTGAYATKKDLHKISKNARNALVVVDAAYAAFTDYDLTEEALKLDNVVVLQTFSKAWGMAGLRLGITLGKKEIINNLRSVGLVFPVSSLSVQSALYWREHGKAEVAEYVGQVKKERKLVAQKLSELKQQPLPSQGNFVFSHFKNAKWIHKALCGMGISTRYIPANINFDDGLRITCPGDHNDLERLFKALEIILEPECILFDMDGVLVDVSLSYREVIRLVVESFGQSVTASEISRAKEEDGANNDWLVTQRLLKNKGVETDLEEVTERFEKLYHGTDETPGLYTEEVPLVNPELLEKLTADFKLGIVTGRPRLDAERFLKIHDLAKYFSVVICQKDAPQKPDPAPVKLAMQKLGVKRAWMIGDAPDDIAAARAANVLPIGMLYQKDKKEESERALYLKGASVIINDVFELLELLP